MIIIKLLNIYDLDWLNNQFNQSVCMFKVRKFPDKIIKKGNWIAATISDKIYFAGQFLESIKTKNSNTIRVYLKPIISFNPISYRVKSLERWENAKIHTVTVNGKTTIIINHTKRIVPMAKQIYKIKK